MPRRGAIVGRISHRRSRNFNAISGDKSAVAINCPGRRDEGCMRQSVVCLVAGWLLLGLWQLAIAAEKEGVKPGPATYVGNEVCQACHAPAFEKFSTTLMGKIFLHNPRNETEKKGLRKLPWPGKQSRRRRRWQGYRRTHHLSQRFG